MYNKEVASDAELDIDDMDAGSDIYVFNGKKNPGLNVGRKC